MRGLRHHLTHQLIHFNLVRCLGIYFSSSSDVHSQVVDHVTDTDCDPGQHWPMFATTPRRHGPYDTVEGG